MIKTLLLFGLFAISGVLGETDNSTSSTSSTTSTTSTTTTTTTLAPTSAPVTKVDGQATIWVAKKDELKNDNTFLCAGAIVAKDHVLTHPACIEGDEVDNIIVALGKVDLASTDTFSKVKNITFLEEGRMALIQTATKDFFPANSVAKLREKSLDTTAKCYVSGWLDSTHEWEEHEVSYVTDENCKKAYDPINVILAEGDVCASSTEGNCGVIGMSMSCDGQLTGIYSQTYMGCELPAQFSGVQHWRNWIKDQINLNQGIVNGSSQMTPIVSAIAALLLVYRAIA